MPRRDEKSDSCTNAREPMKIRFKLWLSAAFISIPLLACTNEEDLGNRGQTAPTTPPAADSCPVSPGVGCNTLPFGEMVHPACAQGTPPKSTGGSITDGSYVLTAVSVYGGGPNGTCSNTQDRRGAASFHAGTLDLARDYDPLCQDPVTVNAKLRQTWKVSVSGSMLSGPQSCDTYSSASLSSGNSWSYTATSNTLVLVNQDAVSTYTLVP